MVDYYFSNLSTESSQNIKAYIGGHNESAILYVLGSISSVTAWKSKKSNNFALE